MAECEDNEREGTQIHAASSDPERSALEVQSATNQDGARGGEVCLREQRQEAELEEPPRRGGRRRHHSYSSLNSSNEHDSPRDSRGVGWGRGVLGGSIADSLDAPRLSGGVHTRGRSSPVGGAATKKRKKKGRCVPPCGKVECGYASDLGPGPCPLCSTPDRNITHAGQCICSACHREPPPDMKNKKWRHLTTDKVEAAAAAWATSSQKAIDVKDKDFRPSTKCVCTRPTCFWGWWGRERYRAAKEAELKCAACGVNTTPQWRSIFANFRRAQHWLHSGKSRGKRLLDASIDLEPGSKICNACNADFVNKGVPYLDSLDREPRFTVKTYLAVLCSEDPPQNGTPALAVNRTVIGMLETLRDGGLVGIDDGIDSLATQRHREMMVNVSRMHLKDVVSQAFTDLSSTVSDVSVATYRGNQLGKHDRTNSQYLMPANFDGLYVAKLQHRERKLQEEVSRLRAQLSTRESSLDEGVWVDVGDGTQNVLEASAIVRVNI